ncbi:MAG: valine--tRNA ligase [Ellagibacter isourolithinifaciens]|uniref:valine--tRNA ligase n=2 Tax=Ellagibacter isourolithinifaciens TaxID=2137581 RepID=UPI002A910939|nr:valine--tRNA ligase [Ellagibacter isourolithinifaciens]MDY6111373.1 valine--tRNA ligase [Ellagibacter isourolithinifaciens]
MENMPKNYDAEAVEQRMLDKWLAGDYYRRNPGVGDCTVTIPPPNVTGKLHMGHALDDTIQDTIIRMNRMRGVSTRWILGTDHAGIATQTKVDKKLASEGISRREIGREKFVDACWDWTHEYGGHIVEQIKRMGCSIDFSDPHFTMDADYATAVRKVFCDWYHDGLIYRGKRIVNWCPHCTTAIADDEAEYKEEDGHLWYLRYPLVEPVDGQEYVVVATTRPETMLGDTGVAVSPKDHDKDKFVGAKVRLPIVDREIPIFSDFYVDAGFGTGFVKVTPAHDPNDYGMGERHGLEKVNIFDETAHVVEGYGEFSGMGRDECRQAVVAWFEEHGLLDHVDDHHHSVMHCYRCDSTLEPWLSEQWFVAVDKLKGPATEAVTSGKVTFHPSRWTQTYLTWMENLKDWCISRQLWWGHRIPVFHCEDCGWEDALMEDTDVCPKCGSHHVAQEEDVLDTWFSSQLWTFATQGWPEHPERLEGHHPTTALVTARDIIALWVARMIMSSTYFLKEIPFKDVVIYATILAKDGTRMSKSKGNGVDPMDLISMYGADAMRFNLLTLVTNNQDVRFDADIDKKTHELLGSPRTESARAFVTKIWNASRFVLGNLDGFTPGEPRAVSQADAWIFSRLAKLSAEVTKDIETYQFGEMARELHAFFWNEFCDWYIEFSKASLREEGDARLQTQRNLVYVLDNALRLLHPAMPFVTEAIWENVPHAEGEAPALMMAKWPEPESLASLVDEESERAVSLLCDVVSAVRSTRARYGISPKQELPVVLRAGFENARVLEGLKSQIISMARASELSIVPSDAHKPAESACVVAHGCEVYCVLTGLIDFEAERARLTKERATLQKDEAKFAKKLSNPGFLAKAAPEIVEKDTAKLAELRDKLARVEEQLAELG